MLLLSIRTSLTALFLLLAGTGCSPEAGAPAPVDVVDPLIGTSPSTTAGALRHSEAGNEAKGQTFPAVGAPFGMTHWTPQTQAYETKCVVPYYYQDTRLQGFRGTHWWSGSCTQDYGSVTLMALTGPLQTAPEARASAFSHDRETATPAYYRVSLDTYGVTAELTGSTRAGLLRFTVGEADSLTVLVQPNSDEGEGFVEIHPERNEIVGTNPVHRIYQGWGEPAGFGGHFVAVFDQPLTAYGTWHNDVVRPGTATVQAPGDSVQVGGFARFATAPGAVVQVKIGTSFTSIEQARKNLEAELPDWEFERARHHAESAWNDALGTVTVQTPDDALRTTFYTALYHSMLLPRVFSDVDGTYPGFAGTGTQTAEGFTYYDDFSVWDTYRALHPLLTLLQPQRNGDMVRSLVAKGRQGGWLPIFPGWNSYTSAMIGDHVFSIIVDAYVKGFHDFDVELAYALMHQNATQSPSWDEYVDGKGRRALPSYLQYGYIPEEDSVWQSFHTREQVSRTLEYAYDDFVLAQLAEALGKADDHATFLRRAANYRNVFDPSVGFVRGRHADGSWTGAFVADERQGYITEGTPWHYTWYVPHDVQGLIDLMGGRERFVQKLDALFDQGLYWHGNEPGHQIAYLYAYAGAPWKTQQRVPDILREEYGTGPGGLSGNDDAGQMSAWYVFSALGVYPVVPGRPYYVIGTPAFEEAALHLANGNRFTIQAHGVSSTNRYIQRAMLNDEPFDRPWIRHDELLAGGRLVFEMGPEPNPAWGSDPDQAPPSMSQPGERIP